MSTIFLHPKRGSFYHRSHVPRRLRALLNGRAEVWRSLDTADKDEARARSAQWDARIQRLFQTLRTSGEGMTKDEREQLVAQWLEAELEYAEDCRAVAGPMSDAHRESQLEGLWIIQDDNTEALLTNNYRRIEKEADQLLKAAGLPALHHDSVEFTRLCRRLLVAREEYISIEQDRWDGIYIKGSTERLAAQGAAAASGNKAQSRGPFFSKASAAFFKENARAKRADDQVRTELERFVEVIGGDRRVGSIVKADCRAYKENMLHVRKLGLATVIKHLSNLFVMFKWFEAQGFIPENSNPVRGLSPNKKQAKKAAQDRRPFTDEELVKVFGSAEYRKQRDKDPARYWLPLLCLFSVCRREEAGQLAVCDIREEAGIPFLHINDDEKLGQSLKNAGSRRRVPIHSALVMLGFMKYVERIRQAGHVRLFPELTRGANGYSDPVGKWFGRLLRSVGVNDPAIVLHSTRHTGISQLTGVGVPQDIREILAGHAAAGVHGQVYVHRANLPLQLLQTNLEKLDYSAVLKALIM